MADLSPELAAKIDDLKARHAENPSRFFMPLAKALREAGETAEAEALLREKLKVHPGYLSAHVLLGSCLADRGALAEARNEFQYVLSVDPQNLIALRTLGDIAAERGERDQARRWYQELLSVDPRSGEAREALAALDAAPEAPAAPAGPAPAAAPQDDFGIVDLSAPVPDLDAPAGDPDFGAWRERALDDEPAPEPAAGAEAASFDAFDFGSVDLSTPVPAVPEEPLAHEEPPVPETPAFDAWGSVDDGQDGAAVEPVALEGYFEEEPAHAADEDEVVTETMAELYARQGFTERAVDVYRELVARRGPEPALVRRLEELERGLPAGEAAEDEAEDAGGEDLPFLDTGAFGGAPSAEAPPSHDFGGFDGELPPVEFQSPRDLGPSAEELPAPGLTPDFGTFDADLPEAETSPAGHGGFDADLPPAELPSADQGGFGADLPSFEPAPADDAPPAWLQTVDAVVSGRPFGDEPAPAEETAPIVEDTGPVDDDASGFDLPAVPDEVGAWAGSVDAPISPDGEAGVDAEAAGPADPSSEDLAGIDGSGLVGGPLDAAPVRAETTGDAFADTFAHGFGVVGGEAATDRAEWEAPSVEATAPVADLLPEAAPEAEAPEVPLVSGEAAPPLPPVETVPPAGEASAEAAPGPAFAAPAAGGETIGVYLSAILAWRPGRPAEGAAPPVEAAPFVEPPPADAAPPPVEAWDDRTLGAEGTETPLDAPWIAGAPTAAAASPDAEEEPWAAAPGAPAADTPAPSVDVSAEDEPWAAPAAEAPSFDPAPSEAPAPEAAFEEEMPWLSPEPEAPAPAPEAGAAGGEAPMPWEVGFDISEAASEAPPAEREAPRTEPVAGDGGFSFEDFFSERPAEPPPPPPPAPQPEPTAYAPPPPPAQQPPAAPAPQAQGGGDDDEDLESFQAWLQSLKR